MRLLHTSDWHVGKTLKGRPRLDEQRSVLAEIVSVASSERVDAVLIAGDLYDTAAPSAEAQSLVVRTLLDLRETGAEVLAIAGNHDHPGAFDAYRPLMRAAGITLVGAVRRPDQGGTVSFTARSTGEEAVLALLPFVSQRYAFNAYELVANAPAVNAASYDERVRAVLRALTAGFRDDAVNLVMTHLTVVGGAMGGGERAAQSIFEYHVPASAFPEETHYVALGHLHRAQTLPAHCPVRYSGAPLAVDFGEEANQASVSLVTASPGAPASWTEAPITSGRRLRTLRGTVDQLVAQADEVGEDWLRVYVREPAFAGLRERVQDALPNALEVRIDPEFAVSPAAPVGPSPTADRSPAELFEAYCAERKVDDKRVEALFSRLHDQVTSSGGD